MLLQWQLMLPQCLLLVLILNTSWAKQMFCIFLRNGFHMRVSHTQLITGTHTHTHTASQRLPLISLHSFDQDQLFTSESVFDSVLICTSPDFSSFCLEVRCQERLTVCYDKMCNATLLNVYFYATINNPTGLSRSHSTEHDGDNPQLIPSFPSAAFIILRRGQV